MKLKHVLLNEKKPDSKGKILLDSIIPFICHSIKLQLVRQNTDHWWPVRNVGTEVSQENLGE
jgi:hypothetical protein